VAKAKKPPLVAPLTYCDVEQNSDEWFEARRGKVTASELSSVLSESEAQLGRSRLMRRLAAEQLIEEVRPTYSNAAMDRGKEMEPEIIAWYARTRFVDVDRMGFIFNPEIGAGWSPDGLIGADGALEVKYTEPELMIEILDRSTFPTQHRAQCHGALLFGRRRWVDLVVYSHSRLPKYVARIEPNMTFHRHIENEVAKFNWELQQLVKRMEGRRAVSP